MLKSLGLDSIDELYQDIPKEIKLKKLLNLSDPLNEPDLFQKIKEIGKKNKEFQYSLRGAGTYFHYIPSLVDFTLSRSEFYTSYTPYQPEMSQGFLQAIYEYQTAIANLTNMDIANASMYDGSTAFAEAAITATFHTRKKKIILLEGIHPHYEQVIKTYCWGRNIEIQKSSIENIEDKLDNEIAAVLFQNPTFFGDILDLEDTIKLIRKKTKRTLIIQSMMDPTCLGMMKPPGDYDIDIFTGEGQSFGCTPSFGGPGLGILAAKKREMRRIPGRIVGKTKKINGEKEGFILTLQTREQHIRRERASSNICSNQALTMLAGLVYMTSLGRTGLREIAKQNFQNCAYLRSKIEEIDGYAILNSSIVYNEFVLKCPNSNALIKACKDSDLLPPMPLKKFYSTRENQVLVCATELMKKKILDKFVQIAREVGT